MTKVDDVSAGSAESVWGASRRRKFVAIGIAVTLVAALTLWVLYAPPKSENTPLSAVEDPFYKALASVMQKNASDVDLLLKLNFLVQTVLVVSALAATVLAALTTPGTAAKYKIYSIIVTATTSAAASFLTSFHVRDNLGAFVAIEDKLNVLETRYLRDRKKFEVEVEVELGNPKGAKTIMLKPDDGLLALHQSYGAEVSGMVKERNLAWANIGIQGPSK